MELAGIVKGGRIELATPVQLREGTHVRVILEEPYNSAESPPERAPRSEPIRRPRRFGSMAGAIAMAPDFDAPLDDFADYE